MDQHADESRRGQEEIGAVWEAAGLLSQLDYAKLHSLSDAIQQGRSLDDPGAEWLIGLWEKTQEPAVRSRVMVILAAAQPALLPQMYRERINAAIARCLNSGNRLDELSAAYLQRALNAG